MALFSHRMRSWAKLPVFDIIS